MPKSLTDVSDTDHRNRYRVGKCGRYRRTPEIIARQSEKLSTYWSDPENRKQHARRWADPAKRARQSEITKAAIARRRAMNDGAAP